jgi:HEPN domain-containing protein
MNSDKEAERRLKLAERHLKETEEAHLRNDYPEVVHHAQLCVENAAKAIISLFFIPSWSHDPSRELRECTKDLGLPDNLRGKIDSLGEYTSVLAPEHGSTNYGTVAHLPEEIYKREDAERALRYTRDGLQVAKSFREWWFSEG